MSTGDRGGCCFQGALGEAAQNPDDNYHRSCICPTATNMSECKSLCSQDQGCKGYTQHSNSLSCVLATTSLCPSSCHGPYKKDNIGLLDMAPSNCAQGEFNGGCYIKENGNSTFSYRFSFLEFFSKNVQNLLSIMQFLHFSMLQRFDAEV